MPLLVCQNPRCGHSVQVAALFLLLAGCTGSTSREPASSPLPQEENVRPENQPAAEKPIKVTVRELIDAYDDNEIAADNKYTGRLIEVDGWVAEMRHDWIGLGLVEDTPAAVICKIDPAARNQFAGAKKDKGFPVIGRCKGMRREWGAYKDLIVILESCRPARR
jgi:hypothetical protein